MRPNARLLILGAFTALLLGACASGTPSIPAPRSVVVFSGERIQADQSEMAEVDRWLREQREDIDRNPSFLIRPQVTRNAGYPWRDFEINGDTALVFIHQVARDAETPFLIYAHLRLMAERDELERWLPEEAVESTGLELEVAILERVADVWLLGRSVYDTQAFGPMDEILFAREGGFLREFVLAAQRERFAEERDAFVTAEPERQAAFVSWLERVFERSEPGYMEASEAVEAERTSGPP